MRELGLVRSLQKLSAAVRGAKHSDLLGRPSAASRAARVVSFQRRCHGNPSVCFGRSRAIAARDAEMERPVTTIASPPPLSLSEPVHTDIEIAVSESVNTDNELANLESVNTDTKNILFLSVANRSRHSQNDGLRHKPPCRLRKQARRRPVGKLAVERGGPALAASPQ
jgi:hypothetical protein